jgi:hypothetical protein
LRTFKATAVVGDEHEIRHAEAQGRGDMDGVEGSERARFEFGGKFHHISVECNSGEVVEDSSCGRAPVETGAADSASRMISVMIAEESR